MKQTNQKGFTMVELIVVIALMAMLVGVLAPMFVRYVEKARQSTDIQNLDSAIDALEAYFSDKDILLNATTVTATVTLGSPLQTSGVPSTLDPEQELVDIGIISAKGDDLPLRANRWSASGTGNTTVPSVVYDIRANQRIYTGESEYYKANAAGTSIDAK